MGQLPLSAEYCIEYGTVQECCGNLPLGSATLKEMKSLIHARSVRASFTNRQIFVLCLGVGHQVVFHVLAFSFSSSSLSQEIFLLYIQIR